MTDEKGFSFDFNNAYLWEQAAHGVATAEVRELFHGLYEANEAWKDDERGATMAALAAVLKFIRSSGKDGAGKFSRPLAILELELKNSPKPQQGNILATARRQAVGRGRRPALAYLQAAAAYATERLGRPVKEAENRVAEVLRDHRFPPEEFSGAAPRQLSAVRAAKIARLASRIKEWRKESKAGASKAARFYAGLTASPPCDAATALFWLRNELEHAGFDSEHHSAE